MSFTSWGISSVGRWGHLQVRKCQQEIVWVQVGVGSAFPSLWKGFWCSFGTWFWSIPPRGADSFFSFFGFLFNLFVASIRNSWLFWWKCSLGFNFSEMLLIFFIRRAIRFILLTYFWSRTSHTIRCSDMSIVSISKEKFYSGFGWTVEQAELRGSFLLSMRQKGAGRICDFSQLALTSFPVVLVIGN